MHYCIVCLKAFTLFALTGKFCLVPHCIAAIDNLSIYLGIALDAGLYTLLQVFTVRFSLAV